MTEQEFLKELSKNLQGVPKEERERSLNFYREIFADKREEGLSEAAAVASVGKPEEVAQEIVWAYYQGEGADGKAPKKDEKPQSDGEKKKRGTKRIVGRMFAIVGWAILGIVILSVWVALPAGSLAGVFGGFMELFSGELSTALFTLGCALIAAVGTVFAWKPVKAYGKFFINFTKKTFGGSVAKD